MTEAWDEIQDAAKKVEIWAKTQSPEIQAAVERLITASYGEVAAEEAERLMAESGGTQ